MSQVIIREYHKKISKTTAEILAACPKRVVSLDIGFHELIRAGWRVIHNAQPQSFYMKVGTTMISGKVDNVNDYGFYKVWFGHTPTGYHKRVMDILYTIMVNNGVLPPKAFIVMVGTTGERLYPYYPSLLESEKLVKIITAHKTWPPLAMPAPGECKYCPLRGKCPAYNEGHRIPVFQHSI